MSHTIETSTGSPLLRPVAQPILARHGVTLLDGRPAKHCGLQKSHHSSAVNRNPIGPGFLAVPLVHADSLSLIHDILPGIHSLSPEADISSNIHRHRLTPCTPLGVEYTDEIGFRHYHRNPYPGGTAPRGHQVLQQWDLWNF